MHLNAAKALIPFMEIWMIPESITQLARFDHSCLAGWRWPGSNGRHGISRMDGKHILCSKMVLLSRFVFQSTGLRMGWIPHDVSEDWAGTGAGTSSASPSSAYNPCPMNQIVNDVPYNCRNCFIFCIFLSYCTFIIHESFVLSQSNEDGLGPGRHCELSCSGFLLPAPFLM